MANIQSAKKRMRQNVKRRIHNRYFRATARTYIKQVRSAIEHGELDKADEALKAAYKALDKAAAKGLIHKNNAARRKSRLTLALKKAKGELAPAE